MTSRKVLDRMAVAAQPDGTFAARNIDNRNGRLFGGQLTAQAIGAAAATVGPDKHTASIHVTFVEPGDPADEVRYRVEHLRDGRTDLRAVEVWQGHRCAVATAAFVPPDHPGRIDHQSRAPSSPPPETLPPVARMHGRSFHVRAEPEHDPFNPDALTDEFSVWFRADTGLPDGWLAHHQLLAYLSDLTVTQAPFRPVAGVSHGDTERIVSVTRSLHLWFHRPFRADAWLRLHHRCPSAVAGRALVHAHWFTDTGVLVASVTQETMSDVRS